MYGAKSKFSRRNSTYDMHKYSPSGTATFLASCADVKHKDKEDSDWCER